MNKEVVKNNYNKGGRVAATSYLHPNSIIEAPIDIADNATIYSRCFIGSFSYINVGSVVYTNTKIGRFCSIGRSVEIGLARHPVDYLSTHPFTIAKTLFNRDLAYASINNKKWEFHPQTIIKNDVWIGAKACILSGVTVGNGAIISAGAIVTKDVPDYAIVGGVPAKIIKMRFDDSIIDDLLKIKWWDLPIEALKDLPFDNINECISILKNNI